MMEKNDLDRGGCEAAFMDSLVRCCACVCVRTQLTISKLR